MTAQHFPPIPKHKTNSMSCLLRYLFLLICSLSLLQIEVQGQLFGGKKRGNEQQEQALSKYKGTREDLIQLLTDIQQSNPKTRIKMARALRPREADYKAVFVSSDFAERVYQFHERLSKSSAIVIQPNLIEQTDILLWEADVNDFKQYRNDAVYFPGGYKEIANQFSPDYHYFRFKYVKPGKSTGSAYDIMVFVNERWRFFPRPWAVVVEK